MGAFTQRPSTSNARPWKIELRRDPIFHRGHAILAFVDPNGETVAELNGMPKSRNADTERPEKVMAHDPAFEIAGRGGQIQNSNSVAYTLGRAMDLDLDGALRRRGMERRFSGWGNDLLGPNYKRYAAPPQFAVPNAP